MNMSDHHMKLDELGQGRCSVPMWSGGCPAGFCDRPAFGVEAKEPLYRDAWTGVQRTMSGREPSNAPGLACAIHGGPSVRLFKDGSAWCAVGQDFANIQESPVGFGDTREQAIAELARARQVDGGAT